MKASGLKAAGCTRDKKGWHLGKLFLGVTVEHTRDVLRRYLAGRIDA